MSRIALDIVPRFGRVLIGVSLWLLAATAAAATTDAQALLHANKCYTCHADDVWKTGPAFRDVAASYHDSRISRSKLRRFIREGQRGHGPWHMPPHREITVEEANAMADYILSPR